MQANEYPDFSSSSFVSSQQARITIFPFHEARPGMAPHVGEAVLDSEHRRPKASMCGAQIYIFRAEARPYEGR